MVKAILDRVFIRLSRETASKGGIILPETIHKSDNVGIVEAIGDDVSAQIKVGDKVLFHPFDELPSYDPDVVVVRESSLLGIVDDE